MLLILPKLQSVVEELLNKGGKLQECQDLLAATSAQQEYLETAADDLDHALYSLQSRFVCLLWNHIA